MRNRTEAQTLKSKAMHEHNVAKKEELLLRAERVSQGNPIDLHFIYIQLIELYYRQRSERENAVDLCIDVCIKDIDLYPRFKQAYIDYEIGILEQSLSFSSKDSDDYEEKVKKINNYKYKPPSIPSFKRLAIIYEQQQKFEEAINICELALKYNLHDDTKTGYKGRINRIKNKIKNPPKPNKKPRKETVKRHEIIKQSAFVAASNLNNDFNEHFMITFSESNSSNFDRALYLAKHSDHFNEATHNNQTIYQASFKPENHLDFIVLYELVRNWKSTFVFKNGKMIDRKIIGQINYCYGDKLRFGDNSFCNGASYMTQNPFGCHRLMVHDGNKPWHSWIKREDNKYIYIDKAALKEHINTKSKVFSLCPAFDYDKIIGVLDQLPNKIDKKSKFYKEKFDGKYTDVTTILVNSVGNNRHKTKPKGLLSRLMKFVFDIPKK